jgi:hypothetical protein
MRAETRAALLEKYRDDINKTAALIGKDLSHWFAPKQR